jgi:hypothetical protein
LPSQLLDDRPGVPDAELIGEASFDLLGRMATRRQLPREDPGPGGGRRTCRRLRRGLGRRELARPGLTRVSQAVCDRGRIARKPGKARVCRAEVLRLVRALGAREGTLLELGLCLLGSASGRRLGLFGQLRQPLEGRQAVGIGSGLQPKRLSRTWLTLPWAGVGPFVAFVHPA